MMRTILAGGVSIEEMAKKRAPYAADTSPLGVGDGAVEHVVIDCARLIWI